MGGEHGVIFHLASGARLQLLPFKARYHMKVQVKHRLTTGAPVELGDADAVGREGGFRRNRDHWGIKSMNTMASSSS
jgi:hypothetical protein